jgi:hypothetical protein
LRGVDGHGWHIVGNVLEVFADGIVWVLKCYDVNGISCQVLGDLDALLCKLEVEVVNVLEGLLIQLDGLGEDVPAQAISQLLTKQG